MQGFLQLKTHRKTWVKRWFALHTDFVLYSFKCEADDQALTATPVPGFTVTHLQVSFADSGFMMEMNKRHKYCMRMNVHLYPVYMFIEYLNLSSHRVRGTRVELVTRKKREHLSYITPKSNTYSRQLLKTNLKGKRHKHIRILF